MRRALLPIALLPILLAAPVAAQTARYSVLVDNGTRAGHLVSTRGSGGSWDVDFIFKDNGRGPELREQYTLDTAGMFMSYSIAGVATFGAPVEESFTRDGRGARWTSKSDTGTASAAGHYLPISPTPFWYGVALPALARRPDRALPLLPSGTLRMRRIDETTIGSGAAARRLQLVAVTGIGFTPTFVWLTDEPAPRLFAMIYPGWIQLIEEGSEAEAAALETRQKEAENRALIDMQQRLARPLAGTTLIRNARIFDSEKGTLGAPADIILRSGRIERIAPATAGGASADNVIDAGGRVMLPGLVDSHVHFGRWDGALHLAAGVTTVRDMGNDGPTLLELIAEARAGRLLAPHIVAAGFIEGESPFSSRAGFVINDLDGARRAVDWYADNGYRQVKIYNSFPREILRETVEYAHSRGLRVSGHVPVFMRARDVVEAGYDELQHINQVLLNFLVEDSTDTRTLERFRLVADRTAGLDFDSQPVRDFIAMLAERQIVVDPTVATFDFIRQRDGNVSAAFASIADHLPPDVQRVIRTGEMDIPDDETAARYERSYEKLVEFIGRMHAAGVPIVAGTDAVPGFSLHRELELYVMAGMTPAEALRTATWNGAKYAGVLDDRGSIQVGKRADLIFVEGDPTADISAVRRTSLVIMGETAYYPSELFEALGVRPFVAPIQVRPGN
jgi:cytosine/adenosine deaminase-related metal-dependent hydrolase